MIDPAILPSLSWAPLLTLAVVAAVLIILALDVAPADLTMLGGLLGLTVAGVISPRQALSGFANESVLAIGALFIVAAAVRDTGAMSYLYGFLTPRHGSIRPALLRTMLPAAMLSSVMNNTPIVAILTPVTQARGRAAGIAPSRLLIPLAYATTLGGLMTLIGTSTNLVVSGLLTENGHRPLGMFELTWIGLPGVIVGILYFLVIGHKLLPSRSDDSSFDRNEFRKYQFELRIPNDSPLDGTTVEGAGLRALGGAFLAHIHRDGELISIIAPDQVLRSGDVLAFVGNPQHLNELLDGKRLSRAVDHPHIGEERPLQLYEAVVTHDSTLVGQSLRDIGFRQRFQAVVLGIRRRGERPPGALGRTEIEAGDLLLIEARPAFEAAAWTSGEFSLVSPLERPATHVRRKAPLVVILVAAMVLAIGFKLASVAVVAFVAAVAMVATKAIAPQDARRSVDLSVLVTIAASFGIAQAIVTTGVARLIASLVVRPVEALGPVAVLAAVYILTNVLSEILTNNAAAALMFPIAAATAARVGSDITPFAIATAVAASAAFASPLGYQTYLMIMGAGSYRFRDFVRVGLPLNLIMMVLAIPIIIAVWM